MRRSESSSRVARVDLDAVLESIGRASEFHAIAAELGSDAAAARVRSCLEELAIRPQDRWLAATARLARFMYSRSYDAQLDVGGFSLAQLQQFAASRQLVFLWSHKSHLDSFVFLRAIYEAGFRPQPLSFAGANMNFALFGTLARNSGAVFVRRSIGDDAVYKLVFRSFVDYLVGRRLPLSWSIEGTRSRTGKLMPPKLGLLGWVIDACRRTGQHDALLVPVAIAYEQIAEIGDYVAMQRGEPKKKESLGWFLGYILGMQQRVGRIHVRFAEPVPLDASIEASDALVPARLAPERARTLQLAWEVCRRIEQATPVTEVALASIALLAAGPRSRSAAQLCRDVEQLLAGLPATAAVVDGERPARMRDVTLEAMRRTGLVEPVLESGETHWRLHPGRESAALYYANTIAHHFLVSAIAELAHAVAAASPASATDAAGATARARAWSLRCRDLMKFEFFFQPRDVFAAAIERQLDRLCSATPAASGTPLLAVGLLRPYIEAYASVARTLHSQSTRDEPPEKLARECLRRARELLDCGAIRSPAAVSLPMIENALRLAANRALLPIADRARDPGRAEFAAETAQLLGALNTLS